MNVQAQLATVIITSVLILAGLPIGILFLRTTYAKLLVGSIGAKAVVLAWLMTVAVSFVLWFVLEVKLDSRVPIHIYLTVNLMLFVLLSVLFRRWV